MIHVLVALDIIFGCLVFNFISTPFKSDENVSIIYIIKIENGFVRVTRQILDKFL